MGNISVVEVESTSQLKAFIDYPNRLYRDDPNYVAPLTSERREFFDSEKNPFYHTARVKMFLAMDGNEVVGRIATNVNYTHNEFHDEQVGFFGFFDCPDDYSVAATLLKVAMITLKKEGMEKMRGHVRVTFLTGLLSFEDYTAKHKIVSELANRFTCHFGDVEDSVVKLVDRNGSLRKELTALQKKLMPYEVERLKENGPEVQGVRIVIQSYDDQGPKQLKDLAMQVTRAYDSVAILASQDKLLISVSEGLPTNAAKLAKSFMEKCAGKGGGSPAFAQIGGIPPDMREEYLRDLVNLIKDQLSGG